MLATNGISQMNTLSPINGYSILHFQTRSHRRSQGVPDHTRRLQVVPDASSTDHVLIQVLLILRESTEAWQSLWVAQNAVLSRFFVQQVTPPTEGVSDNYGLSISTFLVTFRLTESEHVRNAIEERLWNNDVNVVPTWHRTLTLLMAINNTDKYNQVASPIIKFYRLVYSTVVLNYLEAVNVRPSQLMF